MLMVGTHMLMVGTDKPVNPGLYKLHEHNILSNIHTPKVHVHQNDSIYAASPYIPTKNKTASPTPHNLYYMSGLLLYTVCEMYRFNDCIIATEG